MTYAQFNEEEVLEEIFNKIGTTNKFFVEIGCHENGFLSNTFKLKEQGWIGHWFDMLAHPGVIQEKFTKDNINDILSKYNVPQNLDLLSIDVDGNDYWLFEALTFKPRVVIIEFNPRKNGVVKYDEDKVWNNETDFGSGVDALIELADKKGYSVYTKNRTNLFLCLNQ